MQIHELKILPMYFDDVASGRKSFEVRYDDRGYLVGDILHLREFDNYEYTGRDILAEVTYILDDSRFCKNDYVIMSLRLL